MSVEAYNLSRTVFEQGQARTIARRVAADGLTTDTIVAGSSTLTAMFRRLAIRRTSQGFEVVHRYAGEWVGVSYPACVRKNLITARADLSAHVEKDADRRRDRP